MEITPSKTYIIKLSSEEARDLFKGLDKVNSIFSLQKIEVPEMLVNLKTQLDSLRK